MTLLELLRDVNVLQVRSDLVLAVTGEVTQVAFELLDVEMFLPDVQRELVVASHHLAAVGADPLVGGVLCLRRVDVLHVPHDVEAGVGGIIALIAVEL